MSDPNPNDNNSNSQSQDPIAEADAETVQNDNPISSINSEDPNFIPIAFPVVDSDQNNIRIRRPGHRRRKPEPLPPVFPPLTFEQLQSLFIDYDDYFTNPLVSHHVFAEDDMMVDELDKIIAGFNQMPPQPVDPMMQFQPDGEQPPAVTSLATNIIDPSSIQTGAIPSLLRPDVSNQQGVQFPNDPYNVPGKTVKHGDILVESVDIPQNSNWASGIDYYEEGRLIGFSITCNDPDIVPTVFVESGSSSQTVINNMSFKDMVRHGRGMTYAAATSTINTPNGVMSRDVQGIPSTTFPYIARYKDQYTGDGVYDDVKDTADDKAYVMSYEPSTSIPYQRFSFQVYNGSSLGTRMINKLEIRRIVYVDPEPVAPSSAVLPDMTKFTAAINTMASKMGIQLPASLTKPPIGGSNSNNSTANFANSSRAFSAFSTGGGGGMMGGGNNKSEIMDRLYDDFIKFLYHQRFGKNNNNIEFKVDSPDIELSTPQEQRTIDKLMNMLNGGGRGNGNLNDNIKDDKNLIGSSSIPSTTNIKGGRVMTMNWE